MARLFNRSQNDFGLSNALKSVPEEDELPLIGDECCNDPLDKKDLFLQCKQCGCSKVFKHFHEGCTALKGDIEECVLQHDSDIAGLRSTVEQCCTRVRDAEGSLNETRLELVEVLREQMTGMSTDITQRILDVIKTFEQSENAARSELKQDVEKMCANLRAELDTAQFRAIQMTHIDLEDHVQLIDRRLKELERSRRSEGITVHGQVVGNVKETNTVAFRTSTHRNLSDDEHLGLLDTSAQQGEQHLDPLRMADVKKQDERGRPGFYWPLSGTLRTLSRPKNPSRGTSLSPEPNETRSTVDSAPGSNATCSLTVSSAQYSESGSGDASTAHLKTTRSMSPCDIKRSLGGDVPHCQRIQARLQQISSPSLALLDDQLRHAASQPLQPQQGSLYTTTALLQKQGYLSIPRSHGNTCGVLVDQMGGTFRAQLQHMRSPSTVSQVTHSPIVSSVDGTDVGLSLSRSRKAVDIREVSPIAGISPRSECAMHQNIFSPHIQHIDRGSTRPQLPAAQREKGDDVGSLCAPPPHTPNVVATHTMSAPTLGGTVPSAVPARTSPRSMALPLKGVM